jgi:phosphoheptose isomerase
LSEFIARELEKTAEVIDGIRSSNESMATIKTIAARCIEAYRAQNKVLLAGNGSSAADAQHIAGELVGNLAFDRPALAAVALTVDSSGLGEMPGLCDVCLRVPSNETPKIQEGHIVCAHIICGLIERALFDPPQPHGTD